MRNYTALFFLPLLLIGCEQSKTDNSNKRDKWLGSWERVGWQNDAELKISKINGDTISFYLFASHGASIAVQEGLALIKGNRATYLVNENDVPADCTITFELKGDSLVTITEGASDCGNLTYVWYKGDYYSSKLASTKAKSEKEESLSTIGHLDSIQDSKIRILTGKDYQLFIGSTQGIEEAEDAELNAKVYMSGVQGLYTEMENIIMIDSSNNIWAAVIDDHKVYYYTSIPAYANKLPNTIKEWKSQFDDYPVTYKSAK
jgi:hypothetical protein